MLINSDFIDQQQVDDIQQLIQKHHMIHSVFDELVLEFVESVSS